MGRIDRHFTRELIGIEMSATCSEAARLMLDRRIGALAVRDCGSVRGLITERDLLQCAREPKAQCNEPVSKWMRRLPPVEPSASEIECANLMRDHNTRHLLVEEYGVIVGIVSMRDVIRLMLDEKQFLIDQLQSYISRG